MLRLCPKNFSKFAKHTSNTYKRISRHGNKNNRSNLKQLASIFQNHNCLVPDNELKNQLLVKRRQHLENLEFCKDLKRWYLKEIRERIENGMLHESAYSCFDEFYVISPFGSQATLLSQDQGRQWGSAPKNYFSSA